MIRPIVTFYYPGLVGDPESIPECQDRYVMRKSGNYVWVVRTYGYLSSAGIECRLSDNVPDEGIVISHRDFMRDSLRPNSRQLLVCVVADALVHPYAQVHIVQNPMDPMMVACDELWPSFYLPLWTESGLIPRDVGRGDTFNRIGYFGSRHNLAPQLRSGKWRAKLDRMGLQWVIQNPNAWNDYSTVDAILAVRSFTKCPHPRCPATKLYNAWAAGVPAIFGRESAIRAERKGPLDYIEVRSPLEAVAAIERLKKDRPLREAMVANGKVRAREVTIQTTASRWTQLLGNDFQQAYQQWCSADNAYRRRFLARRRVAYGRLMMHDFGASVYWQLARFAAGLFRR
jgi:hypothetical protein